METDPTAPVTRGELHEELSALEGRLVDPIRSVETNLLTAFHGYARGMFARVSRLEASDTATMERLAAIEARMLELERRLPPAA
jgi:hypothetical protein